MNTISSNFNRVDLSKNWVDIVEVNGQKQIAIEEKTTWKRFTLVLLQICTFGVLGHKSSGLHNVASAIEEEARKIFEQNQDKSDINQILLSYEKLNSKNKSGIVSDVVIKICDLFKAHKDSMITYVTDVTFPILSIIDREYDPLSYVPKQDIARFCEIYNNLPDDLKKLYLNTKDENGNTFLHLLLLPSIDRKGNMIPPYNWQGEFDTLVKMIGIENVMKFFFQEKNNTDKTCFHLALETGQMGILSRLFPIPSNKSYLLLKEYQTDAKILLSNLIKDLSNVKARHLILKNCPGNNDYDKLNHIYSGIHHMVCNGFNDTVKETINNLEQDEQENLSYELRIYQHLRPEDMKDKYDALCDECTSLVNQAEIGEQMAKWHLDKPREYYPSDYIRLNSYKEKFGNFFIEKAVEEILSTLDDKKKNSLMNMLSDLFDPYRAYDQLIDFYDSKYKMKEIFKKIKESKDSLVKSTLLDMFWMKCPDILGREEMTEKQPKVLFTLRTKKALKYFLDRMGREIN